MEQIPIRLSDATGVPYYRQIQDQLTQFIRAGRLPPGARLPSVRELAGQLLVSLITVRRSYADLEADGLIVRRQGHGTYVAREVEMATRAQALKEGRAILADALAHARRLGLGPEEIRTTLLELLESSGGSHDDE